MWNHRKSTGPNVRREGWLPGLSLYLTRTQGNLIHLSRLQYSSLLNCDCGVVGTECLCPFPTNSYVEALTPSVTVFGDRACKKVVKVKWVSKGRALIRGSDSRALSPCIWEHSEKLAIYKPRRELSSETGHTSTLILDLPASRTMRNVCCLSHPVYDSSYGGQNRPIQWLGLAN